MWKKVALVASFALGIAIFLSLPFFVGQGWVKGDPFTDNATRVWWNGVELIRKVIAEVGWLGILAFLATGLTVLLAPALGWWVIMRGEKLKVPFLDAFKANLMGFPLNFITPSLYLGGEPLKVFYLAAKHGVQKRRILATIIVGKFQELASIILFAIVCAAVFIWRSELLGDRSEYILLGLMGFFIAVLALLYWAFFKNWQPTVGVIEFLARLRIARRRMARLRRKAEEMEHLIHLAFTKRWRNFLVAQILTLPSAAAVLVRPLLLYHFVKPHSMLGSEHVAMIYVVTTVLNMFSILPGGIGIFQGGIVGYFSAAKLEPEMGLSLGVVTLLCDLIQVCFGTWLILHLGMGRVAKDIARGKMKVSEEEIKDAIQSEEEAQQN